MRRSEKGEGGKVGGLGREAEVEGVRKEKGEKNEDWGERGGREKGVKKEKGEKKEDWGEREKE